MAFILVFSTGLLLCQEKKSKLSSAVSLGFSSSSGNTKVQSANAAIQSALTDSLREFSFDLRFIYGKNEGVVNQREFLSGLQYDYRPFDRISPFISVQLYSNTFKKIDLRLSGMLGAKYRFYSSKESDYSISLAVQADVENYTSEANKDHLEIYRLSFRPKFKQTIMKNIVLMQEAFFRPVINRFKDYQLLSITSLAFKVNNLIGLKCSYLYDFDNAPITSSVKKTDTSFTSSLVFSF